MARAISLSVGFVAVGIALIVGVLLGALAGYFGGWTDIVISRAIEIMLTIPTFFLIIAIIAFLPPSIYNIMAVIGLTGWMGVRAVRARRIPQAQTARLHYGAARSWRFTQAYNFSAHASERDGPGPGSAVFGIAGAILTESSLSFLGSACRRRLRAGAIFFPRAVTILNLHGG